MTEAIRVRATCRCCGNVSECSFPTMELAVSWKADKLKENYEALQKIDGLMDGISFEEYSARPIVEYEIIEGGDPQ